MYSSIVNVFYDVLIFDNSHSDSDSSSPHAIAPTFHPIFDPLNDLRRFALQETVSKNMVILKMARYYSPFEVPLFGPVYTSEELSIARAELACAFKSLKANSEEEAKEKANRPKDLSYIWDSFPKVSPSVDLLVPVKNIESSFEDSEFHVAPRNDCDSVSFSIYFIFSHYHCMSTFFFSCTGTTYAVTTTLGC